MPLSMGWGTCRLAQESVPQLPGLGPGRLSAGPEAGFAKRSRQHPLFRSWGSSRQRPWRFGVRELLRGSHKDTFSPHGREGRQSGRHKGSLFHISRQPAHSVKAAEEEESSKHSGRRAWCGQQIKRRGWRPRAHWPPSPGAGSHALAIVWAHGL